MQIMPHSEIYNLLGSVFMAVDTVIYIVATTAIKECVNSIIKFDTLFLSYREEN